MQLSKKLKQLRKQNNHTQKQFAQCLGIGHTTYQKYETGIVNPRFELLKKICQQFPEYTLWLMIDDTTIGQSKPKPKDDDKHNTTS